MLFDVEHLWAFKRSVDLWGLWDRCDGRGRTHNAMLDEPIVVACREHHGVQYAQPKATRALQLGRQRAYTLDSRQIVHVQIHTVAWLRDHSTTASYLDASRLTGHAGDVEPSRTFDCELLLGTECGATSLNCR